jgi:glycosyltransferase involved in cell wall biosynthesis
LKVLIVSLFVDPDMKGSGSIVFKQAEAIAKNSLINVEILTNPYIGNWQKEKPNLNYFSKNLINEIVYHNIKFNLICPKESYNATNICSNVLDNKNWNEAVIYGLQILKKINPDILHLQHRHSVWWLLESAQILGIKTIYTVHDWGIACQRTVLVKGNGEICDGIINVNKCSSCIISGRSKIGNLNERFVKYKIARKFLSFLFTTPLKSILYKYNIIKIPVDERTALNIIRLNKILPNIDKIIVPSKLGITIFSQFGVKIENFSYLKWFSDPIKLPTKKFENNNSITISYIGRISLEKDVEIIFKALNEFNFDINITLNITGYSLDNKLSVYLKNKYGSTIKNHKIIWHEWISTEFIYNISDCILILTGCVETGPLTLYESFSYKIPVIATNIIPISENVTEGVNGYLYEIYSTFSLAKALTNFIYDYKIQKQHIFPYIYNVDDYTKHLIIEYKKLVKNA